MKASRISLFSKLAGLSLALALTTAAQAQEVVRYDARPGSKLKIDGTSTVHDWTVETAIIGGFIELPKGFLTEADQKAPADLASVKLTPKLEVSILVRSLKSGKKPMDNVMHDAMNQKDHPRIAYALTGMTLKSVDGEKFTFDTTGDLTVAGTKKVITMPVTMDRTSAVQSKFVGETTVKMTDFGIKPPAPELALGLIKTGDDVKITFEWITERAAAK